MIDFRSASISSFYSLNNVSVLDPRVIITITRRWLIVKSWMSFNKAHTLAYGYEEVHPSHLQDSIVSHLNN